MKSTEVREIRARSGMSQEAFAAHLCVNRTTVLRWESGEIPVPGIAAKLIRTLLRIREIPQAEEVSADR